MIYFLKKFLEVSGGSSLGHLKKGKKSFFFRSGAENVFGGRSRNTVFLDVTEETVLGVTENLENVVGGHRKRCLVTLVPCRSNILPMMTKNVSCRPKKFP